jgi:uncharacterized protein (TIGR02145 family)
MKSIDTAFWNSPNTGATNESGFSVLPGGYRNDIGSFGSIRSYAFFWSASEYDNFNAWNRSLNYSDSVVSRLNDVYSSGKSSGASVRCLKD